jgi:hypothetical protein
MPSAVKLHGPKRDGHVCKTLVRPENHRSAALVRPMIAIWFDFHASRDPSTGRASIERTAVLPSGISTLSYQGVSLQS